MMGNRITIILWRGQGLDYNYDSLGAMVDIDLNKGHYQSAGQLRINSQISLIEN